MLKKYDNTIRVWQKAAICSKFISFCFIALAGITTVCASDNYTKNYIAKFKQSSTNKNLAKSQQRLKKLDQVIDQYKSQKNSSKSDNKIEGIYNPAALIPKQDNVKIPFVMAKLEAPKFKKVDYDITDYGAKSGGEFLNTTAIAKAIDACAKKGGGRVIVPPGKWLTGPIVLKSFVNLHISKGAELSFSDNRELYKNEVLVRYQGVEMYNYTPFIYAYKCKNIAITGEGVLQGNGKNWWPYDGKRHSHWKAMSKRVLMENQPVTERREVEHGTFNPSFIQPVHCKNVLIDGVSVINGPFWNVHPVFCENIIIRNIEVYSRGPHGDGINPSSCKNVLIERCYIDTRNDCITIKSGLNEDGWRVNKPCKNILIRYNFVQTGYGGIVLGSEISGGVNNLFAHDCVFYKTSKGIRIKSRTGRGGEVKNLYFDSIAMDSRHTPIIVTLAYQSASTNMPEGYKNNKLTSFHDFYFSNISSRNSNDSISIHGKSGGGTVKNVFFKNVTMKAKKDKVEKQTENIHYDNVKIDLIK